MNKVAIIGVGHVGSHVAQSLLNLDICRELVLIDINERKALSHAIDLGDMSPYLATDCDVYMGDYCDLDDADIVIISACSLIFDEDRLRELKGTLTVMDDIVEKLSTTKFNGIILSISNPCDLIAQYVQKKTGLNVIGTGTMLDSARMKTRLARALNISSKSVNGYVLGEHGDSQTVPKSLITIGSLSLDMYLKNFPEVECNITDIAENTCEAGWDIVMGKGSTEFGIGAATAFLAKAILNDEKKVLPCSSFMEKYGVYASYPCLIGKNGVEKQLSLDLAPDELSAFENSCNVLKDHAQRFNII
ncbi:MAG: hypothetical protein R3Y09_05885 [Clostridia bacterium]